MKVRAYYCTYGQHTDKGSVINAQSAGKARYLFLLRLMGAGVQYWGPLSFKDIKVKSLGPPQPSEIFEMAKEQRNIPNAEVGQEIHVWSGNDKEGNRLWKKAILVDAGSGSNFVAITVDDGCRGYYHPGDIKEFCK